MMSNIEADKLWYQPGLDVFLNRWFASYEAAQTSLAGEGGFLLPYENHFFVCEAAAIEAMGLDPDDSDWERIGHDCVRPADADAFQRLHDKRVSIVRDRIR